MLVAAVLEDRCSNFEDGLNGPSWERLRVCCRVTELNIGAVFDVLIEQGVEVIE